MFGADDLLYTCSECGAEFPADPDAILKLTWHKALIPNELLPVKEIEELKEIGLSREKVQRLMNGEEVQAETLCICKPCQDKLANESDNFELE